mmetsp:Transcript_41269/g.83256  ORF Transcript_41269/g.83256 Transcript_41269/m.83256 type:complete len:245 (-) Transcript_41269:80-814(-)
MGRLGSRRGGAPRHRRLVGAFAARWTAPRLCHRGPQRLPRWLFVGVPRRAPRAFDRVGRRLSALRSHRGAARWASGLGGRALPRGLRGALPQALRRRSGRSRDRQGPSDLGRGRRGRPHGGVVGRLRPQHLALGGRCRAGEVGEGTARGGEGHDARRSLALALRRQLLRRVLVAPRLASHTSGGGFAADLVGGCPSLSQPGPSHGGPAPRGGQQREVPLGRGGDGEPLPPLQAGPQHLHAEHSA